MQSILYGDVMERVLVTGATGFIGSHMVNVLLENGYDVVAMARNPSKAKKLEEKGIEVRYADLGDFSSLNDITKGVDFVIHLAAHYNFHTKWPLLYKYNVLAAEKLAEDAIKHNVQHFIFTSTTEAIGPTLGKIADENTPCNPAYDYGKSKLMAEKLMRKMHDEKDFSVTIVRPSGVYGPGDFYVAYSAVHAIAKGKMSFLPGDGSHLIQFVYVKDLVDGYLKTLGNEKALGETYILTSEDYHTYKEIFTIIANILEVPPPKRSVPVWFAKIGVWFYEKINALKGINDFVFHVSVVNDMQVDRFYSIEKAKRELGYQPKYTFEAGMRETIKWYKENGYI